MVCITDGNALVPMRVDDVSEIMNGGSEMMSEPEIALRIFEHLEALPCLSVSSPILHQIGGQDHSRPHAEGSGRGSQQF